MTGTSETSVFVVVLTLILVAVKVWETVVSTAFLQVDTLRLVTTLVKVSVLILRLTEVTLIVVGTLSIDTEVRIKVAVVGTGTGTFSVVVRRFR